MSYSTHKEFLKAFNASKLADERMAIARMKQRQDWLMARVESLGPRGTIQRERAEGMIRWTGLIAWDEVFGNECSRCADYPQIIGDGLFDQVSIECVTCNGFICLRCLPHCFFSKTERGAFENRESKTADLTENETITAPSCLGVPLGLICPGCVSAWRTRKASKKTSSAARKTSSASKKTTVKAPAKRSSVSDMRQELQQAKQQIQRLEAMLQHKPVSKRPKAVSKAGAKRRKTG